MARQATGVDGQRRGGPVWRTKGAYATIGRSHARVAERQTRCVQVAVSERAWGFKSPLAHPAKMVPTGLWSGPSCFGARMLAKTQVSGPFRTADSVDPA